MQKIITSQFLILVCLLATAICTNAQTYNATNFGTSGSATNQFNMPYGVFAAPDGKIYVAELDNNRISVWTQSGNNFGNYTTFGTLGSGINQFTNPIAITVAADGKIYVADHNNHRIQVLTQSGTNIGFYATFGSGGAGTNQLNKPIGVSIAADGKIYVSDQNNNRIQVLTQSGTNIGYYASFGTQGSGTNQLNSPMGLNVTPDGKIYLADYYNSRIQVLTQSGTNIGFYATYGGTQGNGPNQINGPTGVSVDSEGKIYAVSQIGNRILILTQSGINIGNYASLGGALGSGIKQFYNPFGVSLSPDGKIYVADLNNQRIAVWNLVPVPFDSRILPTQTSSTNEGDLNIDGEVRGLCQANTRSVKLEVSGSFDSPNCTETSPRYRWFFDNNTTLSGDDIQLTAFDNQSSITFSGVNITYGGYYALVNTCRSVYMGTGFNGPIYQINRYSSSTPILNLNTNNYAAFESTTITSQPISQSICPNTSAIFTVSATGTGNLSYVWSNGASTTTSMVTSTVGTNYLVTVSGTCGIAVSNVVSLNTILGTSIATHPLSQTICGGNMASFTVSATGSNLAYTWNSISTTLGFNTSVAGSYMVTVTGLCGNAISNPALLSVKNCKTEVTITGFIASNILSNTTNPISVTLTGIGFSSGTSVTIGGVVLSNVSLNGNLVTGTILGGSNISDPNSPIIFVQNQGLESSLGTVVTVAVISSVNNNEVENGMVGFSIYPNPSNGGLFGVELKQTNVGNELKIFNGFGTEVFSNVIDSATFQINTQLSPGVYLVKVGKVAKKLIIE